MVFFNCASARMGRTAVLAALVFAGTNVSISAKTIALWPLCDNKASPSVTGMFAPDPRFDLTISTVSGVPTVEADPSTPGDWNVPPNPDSRTAFGRTVAVRGSAKSTRDGDLNSGFFYATDSTLAGYMMPTNDFTVEGWTRVDSFNTAVSTWRIIVQAGNGSSGKGGWTLSLRKGGDGKGYYLNFFASNVQSPTSGDLPSYNFIDGRSVVTDMDILGSWHHYAIVFSYDGLEANKSTYRIYFDGRLVDTYSFTKLSPEQFTNVSSRFDLGGRTSTPGPRLVGAFSYWRLSDAPLSTTQFLNAGTAGTAAEPDPEAEPKTVLELGDNSCWVDTGSKVRGDACTNCTFETWVYPMSPSGQNNLLCQFSGGNYRSYWTINVDEKKSDGLLYQKFGMYVPGSDWVIFSSKRPVRYRQWNHLALVIADDEWRFYMNGELDSVMTGCAGRAIYGDNSTCDGVVIGNQRLWGNPPSPNGLCNARFAESRVWSRARTSEEIAANCLTRLAKPWLEPDLIGYLPLDDGTPGESAEGRCARNCANIDVRNYTKSSEPENYIQSLVKGGVWRSVGDLPLMNNAPTNRSVVRLVKIGNIQTNSVDSLVTEVSPQFTFTGWYLFRNRGSTGWQENCIFSKAWSGNGRFHLREQDGMVTAWYGGGSNGATNEQFAIDLKDRLPLGKWVHIGFVRDGQFVRLYLDGELVGEAGGFTLPFLASPPTYQFGGFNAGGSQGGFTGYLCEIGLWKTAFTAEQIQTAMTARPTGSERKLLGYWPMDDAKSDALRNLKEGGPQARPVGPNGGSFDHAQCANLPVLDGDMGLLPPPGLLIIVK